MKILKVFGITVIALLLTGCYTQLQYSQTMREVTDQKEKEAKTYSWNDDEKANEEAQVEAESAQRTEEQYADSAVASEEYIPIPYKNYGYADAYDACNCDPYYSYNFYGDSYFFPSYGSWYNYYRPRFGIGFTTSHFYRWQMRHYWGSSLTFGFSWGYPGYHSFYDPFYYDPFYDYYWYHRSPFAFNYYYFYGKSGYGHGYYDDRKSRRSDVRYGPRTVGADRVVTNRDRSRDAQLRSRTINNDGSRQEVRTRSVGSSRSRATVDRNSSSTRRIRSRTSNENSATRTRSRDNVQSNNRERVYIDRTDQSGDPVIISADRYREIRARSLSNSSLRTLDNNSDLRNHLRIVQDQNNDLRSRIEHNRPTFFNRMKSFFESNSSRFINSRSTYRSNNRAIRSGSSSSRSSTIGRSSGHSRSSVTRSRSSSSSSRSRGTSSSSRSRSGGGSSERSRDN